ncbi:MAG: Gldg family protein [Lentisphaeraceae bacterium]|nr:Gldg family protein [Lentisphaeraceae bacterium]
MIGFTRVKAIAKREFLAYFNSALAYVFLSIFLVLGALFTFNFASWFDADEANLRIFFSVHPYLYLFFVPAIGMRVWAEEDREGTLELLLTMPISTWHAVLGKFLAGWMFLGFALFLTFPMVITVSYLGDPDLGRLFSGYLGSFLAGGMCFSIAALTSAFTRNQVISFLFGFLSLLLISVIGMPQLAIVEYIKSLLPQSIIDTLLFFSIQPHVEGLEKGVLDIRDIIYFMSFIIFGLAGANVILRCRKAAHRHNKLFTSFGIIVFAVIVLLINFLSKGLNYRHDLSADKLYTLTPSTKIILTKLDSTASVRFYFSKSDSSLSVQDKAFALRVEDLLKEYISVSEGMVSYRVLDPKPGSIEEKSAALDGIEPIVKADNTKRYFGLSVSYKDTIKTIPVLSSEQEKMLEYHLTHLFKHLLRPDKPIIGVMTDFPVVEQQANPMAGQYENRPAWGIIDELRKDYTLIQLEDKYPNWGKPDGSNYFELVIIYKFEQMTDKSRFALDQYLLRGGKAIIISDTFPLIGSEADKTFRFQKDRLPYMGNTMGVTESWKIRLVYDKFIINQDKATQMKNGKNPGVVTLEGSEFNKTHKALRKIEKLMFPYAGYFDYEKQEGIEVTPLITMPNSSGIVKVHDFAKKEALDNPEKPVNQLPIMLQIKGMLPSFYRGPAISVQNAISKSEKEAEVILIGDMDFLKDSYTFIPQEKNQKKELLRISDNREMFLNFVDSMVTDGDMIDIRLRRETKRTLYKLNEIRTEQRKDFIEEVTKIQQEYQKKEAEVKEYYRKQENQISLTSDERESLKEAELQLREISDRINEIQHKFNEMEKSTRHKIVFFNTAFIPLLILISWLLVILYRKRRLKVSK